MIGMCHDNMIHIIRNKLFECAKTVAKILSFAAKTRQDNTYFKSARRKTIGYDNETSLKFLTRNFRPRSLFSRRTCCAQFVKPG